MFVAHADAYNKGRILHRDISARNILISDSGTGILIDWDLSKKVKDNPDERPRQYSRTVSIHRVACHTPRYWLNVCPGDMGILVSSTHKGSSVTTTCTFRRSRVILLGARVRDRPL